MAESKQQHTPDWRYVPEASSDGFVVGIDHFVVAGETEIACPPTRQQALLVAAAPELLAALRQMLNEYPDCGCCPERPDGPAVTCGACLASAALAKAEGRIP